MKAYYILPIDIQFAITEVEHQFQDQIQRVSDDERMDADFWLIPFSGRLDDEIIQKLKEIKKQEITNNQQTPKCIFLKYPYNKYQLEEKIIPSNHVFIQLPPNYKKKFAPSKEKVQLLNEIGKIDKIDKNTQTADSPTLEHGKDKLLQNLNFLSSKILGSIKKESGKKYILLSKLNQIIKTMDINRVTNDNLIDVFTLLVELTFQKRKGYFFHALNTTSSGTCLRDALRLPEAANLKHFLIHERGCKYNKNGEIQYRDLRVFTGKTRDPLDNSPFDTTNQAKNYKNIEERLTLLEHKLLVSETPLQTPKI